MTTVWTFFGAVDAAAAAGGIEFWLGELGGGLPAGAGGGGAGEVAGAADVLGAAGGAASAGAAGVVLVGCGEPCDPADGAGAIGMVEITRGAEFGGV